MGNIPDPLSRQARGYDSRWDRSRAQFLTKHPLCKRCQERDMVIVATVVDHIIPHRLKEAKASGDPEKIKASLSLFWDRKNWQPLCQVCHSGAKQQEEKSGVTRGFTRSGLPLDPNHHWNR